MSTVSDITVDDVISFRSKARNDDSYYKNIEVLGLLKFDAAASFSDVIGYNTNVLNVDSSIPDIKNQMFILFRETNTQTGTTNQRVFSLSWINESSLKINTDTILNLKIYNVADTEVATIMSLLQTNNYVVENLGLTKK